MGASKFLAELERLAKASEAGHFSIVLNEDNLLPEQAEAVRLINKAIKNYFNTAEYEKKQLKEERDKFADTINRIAGILLRLGIDNLSENLRARLLSAVTTGDLCFSDESMEECIEASFGPALTSAVKTTADEMSSLEVYGLTPVDGLDIAKGIEHFDNNKEWYLKILRSYTASTRAKLGLIEIFSEENLAHYEVTIHGIKGSSYGIYAQKIGKDAGDLEKAAMAGDCDYIRKHNPLFLQAAWELVHNIENMLNVNDGGKVKQKKDKPDDEALKKLLAACESYDMDEVEAAINEITAFKYDSDGGLADWLQKNVEEMNYELIVQKLSV